MATHRAEVINELAHLIIGESCSRTAAVLRVAITGITASGKSILATELVTRINELGSLCVHLPVDGFHNPRSIRYRRGRDSAEGYYRDAYDYDQLIGRALLPLGSPDECWYVASVFDLDADAPIEMSPTRLDPGSIVILDASFLLRPEVRDYFDYRVFVQTSFEEARARGVRRDAASLGGADQADRLYRHRYHAAQQIYFADARPIRHADALFLNEQPEEPALFVRPFAGCSIPCAQA